MGAFGFTLSSIAATAAQHRHLRRADLSPGDQVFIVTANSTYAIRMLDERSCIVSGGWFDRKGLSPARTRIVGCTWGGSAINIDVAAACGLRLEFGNRVVTTPIQKILVLRHACEN
jgi:hypothetical protein